AEASQDTPDRRGRQRSQSAANPEVDARDPLGRHAQDLDDFAADEVAVGEEMTGLAQCPREVLLVVGAAAGGMPFRMKQSRKVVNGDERAALAGQGNVVGLVVQVARLIDEHGAEVATRYLLLESGETLSRGAFDPGEQRRCASRSCRLRARRGGVGA